MRLHDPQTEKQIFRIATELNERRSFEQRATRWWSWQIPVWLLTFLAAVIVVFAFFIHPPAQIIREILCAIFAMLGIRAGINSLSVAARDCGLYSILVNLPVTRLVAFGYVRTRFFHKFGFLAFAYVIVLIPGLYGNNFSHFSAYHFLLFGILLVLRHTSIDG